ncbi:MAG: hypothetical protein A3F93_03725 [Candidatus Magasanikbacteria bacterium RIFCSPLOWO2_12_FULL_34_7]|nr:MAG: hypothetical protein A3F93_03725 [Candidatus Magasanikbacteria bacterium RIFCSPLOWO2_12_FULL_34_7]
MFASSSVVYGDPTPERNIFSEEDEGVVKHMSPRGSYDEGKRFAETCVDTYRQVYGIDVKIARVFTTYGPRMKLRDGLMVPDFILNAIEGKDLIIYGDEDIAMSFAYITDITDGFIKLMKTGPEMSIVNLGSDQIVKIAQVADMIIQMTNSNSKVVYDDPLIFLSKKGVPNLTRAKEMLGWIPLVRLQDGIRNKINYTIANKEMVSLNQSQNI